MSHISFRERGENVDLQVDWVVVGSGPGGAVAAVTLARGGDRVALVEAGAWRDPEDLPSTAYGQLRDMMPGWGSTITMGRALWPVVQGHGVGGTSLINSAICVRTPGDIFELWAREHGLREDGFAEQIWRYQDDFEKELSATATPDAIAGRSNLLAAEADRKLGWEGHRMVRYVKDCEGSGQCLQGCSRGRKQSMNLVYVPELLELGGTVVSCAPVDKVLLRGNRAVGVRGRFRHPRRLGKGAHFALRARKGVFIAASATGSPVLLMRSGVKNPALGQGFRAHPGTGIFGVYKDPVDMNIGATQGWATMKFRHEPGLKLETLSIPPELVAGRLKGGGSTLMHRLKESRHLSMWVQAVRAETVGSVKPGLMGPTVNYTMNDADMRRLREGAYLVAQWHQAAGAEAVIPGIHGMPYKLPIDQIDKIREASLDPRSWVAILSHLFGGCVMGTDPRRSVVDIEGRVHGYEGLYVSDASAIPSTLGVNPQHTIMGLSRRFAERALG